MKKAIGLILPLFAISLTSCSKATGLKYRKQITDTQEYASRIYYQDGTPVPARIIFEVAINLEFAASYEKYSPHYKYEAPVHAKKIKEVALFTFSYNYYYGPAKNPNIGKESVEIAFYKLEGFHNEKDEQAYFVYGYNNPQMIFTNETISKQYVENCKITVYAQDKEGKEISMKSYPVFPGYDMLPRGHKDCEWPK